MPKRVVEGVEAPIEAMVAGEGHDPEAGLAKSGGERGWRAHRQPGVGDDRSAIGDAGLELAESEIGAPKGCGAAPKHRGQVGALRTDVANSDYVDISAHRPSPSDLPWEARSE
jgi:hypothetical protein